MTGIAFTCSIVLYNNDRNILQKAIKSFIKAEKDFYLYLIDNSPLDDLKSLKDLSNQIHYIHNPDNPGFGAAHNLAISFAIKAGSKYHFVVNPDTYFDSDIISPMINYMELHPDVGMMMPQILNPDKSIQYLPKLLPSPFTIIWRKLRLPKKSYTTFIDKYELRFVPDNVIYNAPIISGCFTLLRLKAIEEIGVYDDTFFMYFEDWDLSRRMHEKYHTLYFPLVSVFHEYHSGANKSFKLFKVYLRSAYHYFNKWGWLFDKKRVEINRRSLTQF
jgi:GT2 family glycosyltransferase